MDRILMILALISFILSALNAPAKINWVALGLALWVATLIL